MPANLRTRPISFRELAKDALVWSRAEKLSFHDDELRMPGLIAEFGDRAAEQITAGEFRKWLDSKASDWSLATRNRSGAAQSYSNANGVQTSSYGDVQRGCEAAAECAACKTSNAGGAFGHRLILPISQYDASDPGLHYHRLRM
jgi:hypothetical protein